MTAEKKIRTIFALAASAAFFASCMSPLTVTGGTGSIALSFSIPANTASAYPEALRSALSGVSRYIHPGTNLVEAAVTGNGISSPITASASVSTGQTSVSLTLSTIPAGTGRTLTVSMYGAGGVLLSRATTTVDVSGGTTSPVSLTALPVSTAVKNPGPYSFGVRGAEVGIPDAGSTRIFEFTLPKTGSYVFYFSNYDQSDIPVLYGPDGNLITTQAVSSTVKSFAATTTGKHYVVMDLPTDYSFETSLTIDADTTVTASGPTLYVNPTLTVMDRMRAFTLSIKCGYVPGTPGVDFGAAEGSGKGTTATDGSTITIAPGANGLVPTATAPSGCYVDFTDALLGIARSGATAAAFNLYAAPRTVIYMSGSVSKPADSPASTDAATYANAAGQVNALSDSSPPVIAITDGTSISESAAVTFNKPALMLGGCVGSSWTRVSDTTTSRISLANLGNSTALTIGAGAAGMLFDRMDIQQPNNLSITVSSANSISVAGAAKFNGCAIASSGAVTINASATALNYQFINVGAATLFRDCVIKATDVTETASTAAVT